MAQAPNTFDESKEVYTVTTVSGNVIYCESIVTAKRLDKPNESREWHTPIETVTVYRIGSEWFVPGRIVTPQQRDIQGETKYNAYQTALARARTLGLTSEELQILQHSPFREK